MERWERAKETKTTEELAAMIHEDLSKMEGCPAAGVKVTVYGIPWKSMLTFGAAADPSTTRLSCRNSLKSHRTPATIIRCSVGAESPLAACTRWIGPLKRSKSAALTGDLP